MRLRLLTVTYVVGLVLALASPLHAQQRPLATEDPESVGGGVVLVEAGIDYLREQNYPVSGLTGHLTSLPRVGISVGLSSIAELQLDGISYDRLRVIEAAAAPLSGALNVGGDSTSSAADAVIGMKLRMLGEGGRRPAVGLRFATKLPNASNESGLGLDTMDFFASLLVGKTIQSVRVVTNIGLGILSDPTRGDRQNDVLTYGLSIARAVATGVEIVGEVAGRANTRAGTAPPGTESSGFIRVGARATRGTVRFDGGLITGMTSRDANIGVTAGVTWVFRAFEVP